MGAHLCQKCTQRQEQENRRPSRLHNGRYGGRGHGAFLPTAVQCVSEWTSGFSTRPAETKAELVVDSWIHHVPLCNVTRVCAAHLVSLVALPNRLSTTRFSLLHVLDIHVQSAAGFPAHRLRAAIQRETGFAGQCRVVWALERGLLESVGQEEVEHGKEFVTIGSCSGIRKRYVI